MRNSNLNRIMILCGLSVAVTLTGCVKNTMRLSAKDSIWNPVEKLRADKEAAAEPTEPVNMVCTWKGSIYENTGVPSVRGFGGRVFFYDKDNNAVAAEGELVVYGFDESNEDRQSDKADKKFVFKSDDFQKHKSESGFGTSYSVWIPWERLGGYRKSITLVPIFVTTDKRIIKGGQSINVLNGKPPSPKQLSQNKPYKVLGSSGDVMSAEYDEQDGLSKVEMASFSDGEEAAPVKKSIRSSTISLTPNLARRVAENAMLPQREGSKSTIVSSNALKTYHENMQKKFEGQEKAMAAADSADPASETRPKRAVFGAPAPFN